MGGFLKVITNGRPAALTWSPQNHHLSSKESSFSSKIIIFQAKNLHFQAKNLDCLLKNGLIYKKLTSPATVGKSIPSTLSSATVRRTNRWQSAVCCTEFVILNATFMILNAKCVIFTHHAPPLTSECLNLGSLSSGFDTSQFDFLGWKVGGECYPQRTLSDKFNPQDVQTLQSSSFFIQNSRVLNENSPILLTNVQTASGDSGFGGGRLTHIGARFGAAGPIEGKLDLVTPKPSLFQVKSSFSTGESS